MGINENDLRKTQEQSEAEAAETSETLSEHIADPYAHKNLVIDGGIASQ